MSARQGWSARSLSGGWDWISSCTLQGGSTGEQVFVNLQVFQPKKFDFYKRLMEFLGP